MMLRMQTRRRRRQASLALVAGVAFGLAGLAGGATPAAAQPVTGYAYFSDREVTPSNERHPFAWLWSDMVLGTVRSNNSLDFSHIGSVAQQRRGYLHRSNHEGTGYGIQARYDFRLERRGPPGFGHGEYLGAGGYYDRLVLSGTDYIISNVTVRTLIVEPGTTLRLDGRNALSVTDSLTIVGSEESPVRVESVGGSGSLWARIGAVVLLENARFGDGVELECDAARADVYRCRFDGPVTFTSQTRIDSSIFRSPLDSRWRGQIEVTRSIFDGRGISIAGNGSQLTAVGNTIVGGNGIGVEVRRRAEALLVNNIIAFQRFGVVGDRWSQITIQYCDVFGAVVEDFTDCAPGEGSFSADPLFVNRRRQDFSLSPGSPCIDLGSPELRDPDSSRSDIGALPFDQQQPPFVFHLLAPANGATVYPGEVTLRWEQARYARIYICRLTTDHFSRDWVTPYPALTLDLDSLGLNLEEHADFEWWVQAVTRSDTVECRERFGFHFSRLAVGEDPPLPLGVRLIDAYPNPFNAALRLSYVLPRAGEFSLQVFDVTGRPVAMLAGGYRSAGSYSVDWDATGRTTGVYLVRLEAGGMRSVRKVVLVR